MSRRDSDTAGAALAAAGGDTIVQVGRTWRAIRDGRVSDSRGHVATALHIAPAGSNG
jgi:hypothetical protein